MLNPFRVLPATTAENAKKKKVIPTLGHSYGSMNAFFSIFYCEMDTMQQILNSKKLRDKERK